MSEWFNQQFIYSCGPIVTGGGNQKLNSWMWYQHYFLHCTSLVQSSDKFWCPLIVKVSLKLVLRKAKFTFSLASSLINWEIWMYLQSCLTLDAFDWFFTKCFVGCCSCFLLAAVVFLTTRCHANIGQLEDLSIEIFEPVCSGSCFWVCSFHCLGRSHVKEWKGV